MANNKYLTFSNRHNAEAVLMIVNNNYQDDGNAHPWMPEPEKSPGREFWFFPKPDDLHMDGLGHLSETYSIQPFNSAWKKENPK